MQVHLWFLPNIFLPRQLKESSNSKHIDLFKDYHLIMLRCHGCLSKMETPYVVQIVLLRRTPSRTNVICDVFSCCGLLPSSVPSKSNYYFYWLTKTNQTNHLCVQNQWLEYFLNVFNVCTGHINAQASLCSQISNFT